MQQLQQLIIHLNKDNVYLKAIRQAKNEYSVSELQLKQLTPYSAFQLIKKQDQRQDPPVQSTGSILQPCLIIREQRWHPNQYKLFGWLTVCYAFTKSKTILEFQPVDIDFIANAFKRKAKIFLEYHMLCLNKQVKSKKQNWSEEETNLFLSILKQQRFKGKWSDVSYNLYCKSNKVFFRTSHKCRQMWFNHLNPIVNHSKWTLQEDLTLFKLTAKMGTKWSQISKNMNGVRTQHMVKNRYHSITKKYQSRFQRCSVKKMIQNIGKDLQSRVQMKASCQSNDMKRFDNVDDSFNDKSNEAVSKEESQEKQSSNKELLKQQFTQRKSVQQMQQLQEKMLDENIQENTKKEQQTQKIKIDENIKNKTCQVAAQTITGEQSKDNQNNLVQYQVDYQNIKMDNMLSYADAGANVMEWTMIDRQRHIQLIDYLGVEYEYKQTIFSGTN